jgi:CheY-like chemotaxis protein
MAKIMIVDDDQKMIDLFRSRLGGSHEVTETVDSETALTLAIKHKPDCIILDLSMPGFTGFELCRTLSSLSSTSRIPLVVVSARPSWMYKEFCMNLGAREYFEKPVDFARLREYLSGVTKQQYPERPAQRRAQLGFMLKLRVTEEGGNRQEFLTVSEGVSASGFLCICPADLRPGTIVEVSLTGGGQERRVGLARMVRVDRLGTPARRYGFQFVETPSDWILNEKKA